jgi:hypothetical protein
LHFPDIDHDGEQEQLSDWEGMHHDTGR